MRRSGSTGTNLQSVGKDVRRRGPAPKQQTRSSTIRGILAVLTLVTVVFIYTRYTSPNTAQAVPTGGQHGFLQSENNLVRTGLSDADGQQQTVFAGKQESITAAGRGALQVQADAQSAEDAGAPSGESLGYYWGLPKDKKNKDGQATEASLQHLQKLSEEKAKSSAGQSGFYFSHDIPQDLKASSGKQSVSVAVQVQGQGGSEAQPHRKELRSPEEPRKAALKASQGLQTSASEQQQQQQQPNPLGHYFQGGGARKGGQKGPPSQEAQDPPESPLKYYFTNQIPEEVKARLALDAAVRAKGASR